VRRTLRGDFTRGLRFRLTVTYLLMFSLMLTALGFLFRSNLASTLDSQAHDLLEEEWSAALGYLTFENQRPIWFYDHIDPDEAAIVTRLQRVLLLTDENGYVLQRSETFNALGLDTPEFIRGVIKNPAPVYRTLIGPQGVRYLVKSGHLADKKHNFYLALGRPLDLSDRTLRQFTINYFLALPGLILLTGLLGWLLAGRVISPVNDVSQAAQRITGSSLDMRIPLRGAGDELDHLIDTFNQMMDRLKSSFDQIRQFSTDVSHELRTPLTAIRGQLEVALMTAKSPDQFREGMEKALEDVEGLSNIVRALLLLSQAESGQLVLQKTNLNLSESAKDIVEQFEFVAEEKRIRMESRIEPACVLFADRVQMDRLMSNLLSNAIKYTPEGGSVRLEIAHQDDRVQMVVSDTGVGIQASQLPHIFDRFYRVRTPETSGQQGLGLGLSFVDWIVKAHDGRIDISSEPGEGTRFAVTFPGIPRLLDTHAPTSVPDAMPAA